MELKRILLSTLIASIIVGPIFFIEPINQVAAPEYPLWAKIYSSVFGLLTGFAIYELAKKLANWLIAKFNW